MRTSTIGHEHHPIRPVSQPHRVFDNDRHPGELYPRVAFIVTNLSHPANRIMAFYKQRGTCER
jgi:hypothetical protein